MIKTSQRLYTKITIPAQIRGESHILCFRSVGRLGQQYKFSVRNTKVATTIHNTLK
jgi:hypothetical protein